MAVRKRRAEDEALEAQSNVIDAPMVPRRLTVSENLRTRRIECGLDIGHVAEALRIRGAVLIAIEDGDFDQLPGPAYAVGFVRSYAAYLGLDAEALVLRFKAEAAEISRRPHLNFPLPIRDSHVPTGPLLIICVLLAVLTYGGWYYFSTQPNHLSEMAPAVPERLRNLLTPRQVATEAAPPKAAPPAQIAAPAQTAALPSGDAPAPPAAASLVASTKSAAQPTEEDGVPPVETAPGLSPNMAATLPAAPDLAQPPVNGDGAKSAVTTSYGAPEAEAHVVLHANADSWIQVRDSHSNLLFTRVLKSGEHYNAPNQAGLTLIAGNAGGIDITVDGAPVPKIGEAGRVVRNLSLDPDHLIGAAPHAN
jgi:cytoskeleton protein RodZ